MKVLSTDHCRSHSVCRKDILKNSSAVGELSGIAFLFPVSFFRPTAGVLSRSALPLAYCHLFYFLVLLDVDTAGGWGPWSEWTPCSSTCADGMRNRYRFCDSPPPRYGAKFCEVRCCSCVGLLLSTSIVCPEFKAQHNVRFCGFHTFSGWLSVWCCSGILHFA